MGDREDIDVLDSKVARLKVEYEQYFARVLKREPAQIRDEVDKAILSLSNRTINNTALKFRLNAVVSKYNSYKQYWGRVLRAIDEGTYVRKAEGLSGNGVAAQRPSVPPAPERPREANGGAFEDVYRRYVEARKECHEPTDGITFEGLKKTVEQYRKKIEEQYKTSEIDLKVSIKDGKAKLTITPKKAPF
ncbi:MAG TPA: hypothetical protein DDW94_04375 [Deltaproteobacteria bacterium]|nr:MAG: hypothetical protein A2Z79_12830 [Deltaproteobacteria bacterium GWA2_55_82]OGQ62766.1 MAG: hypothetical protein A3I81_11600 [Deltaproteobacteria bacterium RIFCSPLOWO2_02_FULL_55_12]OIJ73483.1 MAG: hypothetical protein A2V21_303900 [Deltaproteobacteria bacterium GWC2_55_46]HBG46209.1 hypothetical protein [Deltaproteobacteria bacterium]HCY10116.1 hypothetical protein [Deltaproteobacteria bacterium]